MSEENNTEDVRAQWEIAKLQAEAAQTNANAEKLKAEAGQILQQIEKGKLEIKTNLQELERGKIQTAIDEVNLSTRRLDLDIAKLDIDKSRIEWDKAVEKRAREKATDEENFLYRFQGEVSGGTVHKCMTVLTQWARVNPKCDIEIIFSSQGGSIIDGFELFDFIQGLRGKGHHITTGTLGYAASMAGILLQAGDVRWVGGQAWMMIHRAAFGAYGKTFEVEDEVEFVKRMEERILDIFTTRSSLTRQKIKKNWDRKDWWISAEEAVELQLVDEVRAILPEKRDQQ
jgi:ATP-dependent Clp endopeptidase proteolytic subunit ClpP